MTVWPPILDQNLAGRLAMEEPEFGALAERLGARLGGRPFESADLERALGYPWERPVESFFMQDGAVQLLESSDHVEALELGDAPRYPLITFGSNGAPGVLSAKLSVLDEDSRDVLVLAGELAGFDVVASAHVALYGAMPATIVPAAETSVRAGLLLVTAEQFTALTRTEFNYAVARIDGSPFSSDLDWSVPDAVFAYVSRNGAFALGGEHVALRAVPARGRSNHELDQEHLLNEAAAVIFGPGFEAIDVVRRTIADYAWVIEVARPALSAVTNPFSPEDWQLLGR
ncbi:MAG: hypothetical protein ACRDKE_03140 [Solirubrobacterales bacterium]